MNPSCTHGYEKKERSTICIKCTFKSQNNKRIWLCKLCSLAVNCEMGDFSSDEDDPTNYMIINHDIKKVARITIDDQDNFVYEGDFWEQIQMNDA